MSHSFYDSVHARKPNGDSPMSNHATLHAKPRGSVDVYALRVFQAHSGLHAKADPSGPPNISVHERALNQAMMASFKNGLQPKRMIRVHRSLLWRLRLVLENTGRSYRLRSAAPEQSTISALRESTHAPQLKEIIYQGHLCGSSSSGPTQSERGRGISCGQLKRESSHSGNVPPKKFNA